MIQLILKPEDFKNNKFIHYYGDRAAMFTIIDEEFKGHNRLGKINRITVLAGKSGEAQFCTTVIGMGDGVIGIRTDNPELRGKLLNKDNMEQCVILLYEDSDMQG
jgi:hypothetical protein